MPGPGQKWNIEEGDLKLSSGVAPTSGINHKENQMRVRVDPERCQGHTLCAMRAPDVFELSDVDGHATARCSEVPKALEAAVREAEDTCPERAIILSDD